MTLAADPGAADRAAAKLEMADDIGEVLFRLVPDGDAALVSPSIHSVVDGFLTPAVIALKTLVWHRDEATARVAADALGLRGVPLEQIRCYEGQIDFYGVRQFREHLRIDLRAPELGETEVRVFTTPDPFRTFTEARATGVVQRYGPGTYKVSLGSARDASARIDGDTRFADVWFEDGSGKRGVARFKTAVCSRIDAHEPHIFSPEDNWYLWAKPGIDEPEELAADVFCLGVR